MNLRRIEAESYSEALKKVRSVYGDDALIVGTRTLQRGGVLGIGGKQIVEVYVSETKKRTERLKQAREENRTGSKVAVNPPLIRKNLGVPNESQARPGGIYNDPQPARVYPYPVAPVSPYLRNPPVVNPPPNENIQQDRQIPFEIRSEFLRARNNVQKQDQVVNGTAKDNNRLVEITHTLEVLREEVQRLLRRSDGPPWGHPTLEKAYSFLREKDVEEDIARKIVLRLDRQVLPETDIGNGALRGLLSAHLARFIGELQGNNELEKKRLRIFVGPTGVGKTTTIAKLAARERYTYGRKVALITMDTFRIAAVDQLRKYADIIGLELKVVSDPPGFKEALSSLEDYDTIFADSAGRSPSDEMRLGELESFVRAAPDPFVSLVLSVTANQRNLRRAIDRFKRIGFENIVLTKMDETQSPGVILSALVESKCPVSYVTNGQNVPDDIEAVDPQRLADLVLRGGADDGSSG